MQTTGIKSEEWIIIDGIKDNHTVIVMRFSGWYV